MGKDNNQQLEQEFAALSRQLERTEHSLTASHGAAQAYRSEISRLRQQIRALSDPPHSVGSKLQRASRSFALSKVLGGGLVKALRFISHGRLRSAVDDIYSSQLFDFSYYRAQFEATVASRSDLEFSDRELVLHYLEDGFSYSYNPHPLFDTAYYLACNPDVRTVGANPLLHYLRDGGAEGRDPHPLFNTKYFWAQVPQNKPKNANPLQYYLSQSQNSHTSAHPLFDSNFYTHQLLPQSILATSHLMLHYLLEGFKVGLNPHPLFDNNYYLSLYSDVLDLGENPLVHYVKYGASEGRRTSRLFDSGYYISQLPSKSGLINNPLIHYLQTGALAGASTTTVYAPSFLVTTPSFAQTPRSLGRSSLNKLLRNSPSAPIEVFCVYGTPNLDFLQKVALPHWKRASDFTKLRVNLVNYKCSTALFEDQVMGNLEIKDWSKARENTHIGFGAGHNFLYSVVKPSDFFILANPDSYPIGRCLNHLIDEWVTSDAGLIEATQWPAPHPKEYNADTFETPWASGAFTLVDAKIFGSIGGFYEPYFLYTEDVDLSWRFWQAGSKVMLSRKAICCHLTGHLSYHHNTMYLENFYSARNFIAISRRFFSDQGERLALKIFENVGLPKSFKSAVLDSYTKVRPAFAPLSLEQLHPMLKITGFNMFHLQHGDALPVELASKPTIADIAVDPAKSSLAAIGSISEGVFEVANG